MSFYVRRVRTDGKVGYTGPIRSPRQAQKERRAWEDSGWGAEVLESSPIVRADVRAWQKSVRTTNEGT